MTAPDAPTPLPFELDRSAGRPALVLDDEPMIRRIAYLSLNGVGFRVTEADSLATATTLIRAAARPFELVLLDLTLPDGEGITLIPTIRRHSPGARVLVCSGVGELDPVPIGADGFLAKPFTRATLLATVQHLLEPTGPNNPA